MAYTKYSLTPANNNATPPDGAPEGMLPSAVNDTMRDMMAQIRDVGDGIRNGTYTMTAPVITGGSITGVALSGNTFTNPVITGGSINNATIGASTANTGAFTTLSASGATTFSGATVVSGNLTANTFSSSGATITGGSINSTAIGGTTAAAGKFTTLEATGVTTVQAGTVSAPAITTTGDTNTGIFFPAADTIAFTEGGVESMRIDSSGNVGINTTTPSKKLEIYSASNSLQINSVVRNAQAGTGVAAIGFNVSDTSETSSTKAGIGLLRQAPFGVGPLCFYVNATESAGDFTTANERMRLDQSGNLLIGTTTLDNRVTISSSSSGSSAGVLSLVNPNDATNTGSDLDFVTHSSGTLATGKIRSFVAGSDNYPMTFWTYNSGGLGERMRIDKDGNVGIGTSSPATKLQVSGVISSIGGSVTASMESDGTNGVFQVNGACFLRSTNSNPLILGTNNTERMRILSGGEVCIGRTTALGSGTLTVATHIVVTSGSDFVRMQADGIFRQYSSTSGAGFHFTGNAIFPADYNGALADNLIAFGGGGYRYTAIYAVNGTIQTSDGNEKQDIDVLSDAELRVAKKVSKLIKKFRFKDAVVKKGDGARIHVGVIAQDIEAAFASEGLDAHQYGMFCEDSWYTVDGKAAPKPEEPYTAETPNAVLFTRKGVRYDELLAFIIAAQA